ncbi:hypothetical protein AHAS_Ahas03G0168500 [Arachis hypogaea]
MGEMLNTGLNIISLDLTFSFPTTIKLESTIMDWLGQESRLPKEFFFTDSGAFREEKQLGFSSNCNPCHSHPLLLLQIFATCFRRRATPPPPPRPASTAAPRLPTPPTLNKTRGTRDHDSPDDKSKCECVRKGVCCIFCESKKVEESVKVLKDAANTRKVAAEKVLSALSVIEKVKIDPSGFLETLGGNESPGRT